MNLKKAKHLRKVSRAYMTRFVVEDVLKPEEVVKKDIKHLYKILPYSMHISKAFTKYNAIYTQRWWYRVVKKFGPLTYETIKNVKNAQGSFN